MRADGWMMRSLRWRRMPANSSSRSIRSGRLAFARLSLKAKAIELHCTRISFRIFNWGCEGQNDARDIAADLDATGACLYSLLCPHGANRQDKKFQSSAR